MKKCLSIILSIVLLFSGVLSVNAYAETPKDKVCSYTNYKGETVVYYEQADGETYIIEDGKKEYVAIPVLVEEITDPEELAELRAEFNKHKLSNTTTSRNSNLRYSKTMNFSNTLDSTDILVISSSYFYLKCSDLNPSNAKRGFSYYVRFSPDGSTWFQTLYVCKSLLVNTRHRMADLGNGPYIQIKMWSYYGTVNTCLLSIT